MSGSSNRVRRVDAEAGRVASWLATLIESGEAPLRTAITAGIRRTSIGGVPLSPIAAPIGWLIARGVIIAARALIVRKSHKSEVVDE